MGYNHGSMEPSLHRIRVYVDTSVFGGTQDEEFAEASRQFFERVRRGEYLILISSVTVGELTGAPDEVQRVLADLSEESLVEVPNDDEARNLAKAYIAAGALSEDFRDDASHVAIATVAGADLLLSWNFRHIVNYERIRKFNGVNVAHGYRRIEIRSPLEVEREEEGI